MVVNNKKDNSSGPKVPVMFHVLGSLLSVSDKPPKMSEPKNLTNNNGGFGNSAVLWEICVGVALIITQFFMNRSFVGVGYNKYYFDIVFMAFLLLLAVNCRKEFMKMFLILASSIYVSSLVLNHLNVINTLVSLIPVSGFRDAGTVIYYCLIIIISAVFARAIIKDDEVDITGYAALAILSIAIPYVLIKLNPYSSYLIADTQGSSLIQLFFSIPVLWQPFWISGVFKARNNGSKAAAFFSFIWLILLLLIVSIISYFSVPIEARQGIQTSGANKLTNAADSFQSASNITLNYIKENLLGMKSESTVIETEIDSEQKNLDKRLELKDMKSSEDIVNMNLSEALSYFYVTANARVLGVNDFESYPFDVKISCRSKLQGYKGVFKDSEATFVNINGSFSNSEADSSSSITQKMEKYSSANTLSCYFKKQQILDYVAGSDEKTRNYNLRSTALTTYYDAKYSFFSSAYLKRFFIDRDNYEAIRAENKNMDDYGLLSYLGFANAEKYARSKYGGGLLKIGIKIQESDVLVKIDKESKTNNILFEFSASEYAEGNTVINNPEWIVISTPKSIELGAASCSLKFTQLTDSTYLDGLKDLIGTIDTENLNYYIIRSSDNSDLKKFFVIKPGDRPKPISCPINLPQEKFAIGRVDVFVRYDVEYSRSMSLEITT